MRRRETGGLSAAQRPCRDPVRWRTPAAGRRTASRRRPHVRPGPASRARLAPGHDGM